MNRSRMNRGAFVIQCSNSHCLMEWEVGYLLREPRRNRKVRPRDTMMQLAPLPLAIIRPRRLSDHAMLNEVELMATDE